MIQESLYTEYEVTRIFNPSAPLANVVQDIGNPGEDLTKQDHIIIVGWLGKNLDRNYHYSVEN
jgi:hypothetical protein